MWVPAISGTGGGALPTPQTCSAMATQLNTNWQLSKAAFPNLETVMAREIVVQNSSRKCLSVEGTPLLPTPCSSNAKEVGPKGSASQIHNENNGNLCGVIKGLPSVPTGAPMYLNPSFVEEMMGYPVGWTDLGHSETQLSLMQQ
jgi:hypothetical protein